MGVGLVCGPFPAPLMAAQETPPTMTAASTVAVQEPALSAELTSPGNVTVDFKDADIQNVLRIISFKSGVNIVAGKDVTGSVTIRLTDVPWEKALDVVLKTYGYAYDRDGNIIRVTTLENLRKEELSTEVFVLNYAQAADVEKSLLDVLSERGKVRADLRTNTVIVTDMPTIIQNAKKVIDRLDKPTPQVVIEAKVIELSLGDADRLGIRWNLSAAIRGSARPTTFPFPAAQRTALRKWLPAGRNPQTTTTVDSLGVAHDSTVSDFPVTGSGSSTAQFFPIANKAEFTFGTLDFSQFQAVLDLIQSRQDTKILSEPHVTTLNNQEAKILVGEVLAIPTFERNSTTGRMEITGYKDRDVGIRLSVIPQINDQEEVVIKIRPQITALLGYDTLTPDIRAPRFSTREAQTQVRVRSGQTIAIGGLIRENVVDTRTKVPILGNIPLFGRALFSHKDKTVQKTDLLFFMTVHVITDTKELPQGRPASQARQTQ